MDLLLDIVELMPRLIKRFQMPDGAEVWYLDNPTAQNDNLAACMDTKAKQKAFDAWHGRLVADRDANRSAGRGVFIVGSSAAVSTAARAHTNYGD